MSNLNTDKINKDIELLSKAISKWSNVAFKNTEENGQNDCACCQEYLVSIKNACKDCPIKLWSNHKYCQNTPYDDFSDFEEEILESDKDFITYDLSDRQKLAENELDFLTTLKDLLEKILTTTPDSNTKEYKFYKNYTN